MSRLFFGSYVEAMQESFDLDNHKELIGYLLCLPMECGEYRNFFNNKNDKKPVICFGRECGIIDDAKATRICKAGSSNERIDKNIRPLFLEPARIELMIEAMEELISRFAYAQVDTLIENIIQLIKNDPSISQRTKDAILGDYEKNNDEIKLLVDTLIYASQRNAKPPTNNEVFRSYFPPVVSKFVGREEVLRRIKAGFNDNHVQVIHGGGGMGKTQLAAMYAISQKKKYDSIWWVDASTEQSILDSYRLFMRGNYLESKDDNADAIRACFINFMDDCSKWLIIYDNCDYYTDRQYNNFISYLPHSHDKNRDILITSRTNQSFGNAASIELDVFSEEEAVKYLVEVTGNNDRQGALQLAKRLGCLPLALEYAASYIKEIDDCSYEKYIKLLKDDGISILDERTGVHSYSDTVRQAFELSREKMISEAGIINPIFKYDLIRILNILSYLSPNGIDLRMFQDVDWSTPRFIPIRPYHKPSYYDGKKETEENYYAIREYHYFDFYDVKARRRLASFLKKYSIAKIDRAGRLYMHPLTQELIRNSISEEDLHYSSNNSISDDALELCMNYLIKLFNDNGVSRNDILYAIAQLEGVAENHDDLWDVEDDFEDDGFTEKQDALAVLSLLRTFISTDDTKESMNLLINKTLDLYENHYPRYTRNLFPYYLYILTTNLIMVKYADDYSKEISKVLDRLLSLEIYMSIFPDQYDTLFIRECRLEALCIWAEYSRCCSENTVVLTENGREKLYHILSVLICCFYNYYKEPHASKIPIFRRNHFNEQDMLSRMKDLNPDGKRRHLCKVQLDAMTAWIEKDTPAYKFMISQDLCPELPWKNLDELNKLF